MVFVFSSEFFSVAFIFSLLERTFSRDSSNSFGGYSRLLKSALFSCEFLEKLQSSVQILSILRNDNCMVDFFCNAVDGQNYSVDNCFCL